MLELRPSCEHCNTALPPSADNAMICSFECTFCADCVRHVLNNVCPNCGGGFCQRPVRPRANRKGDNYLGKYPAGTRVVYKPVDTEAQRALADLCAPIPPAER